MNKYIFAECTEDFWPTIKTIGASSYNEAVDKVIKWYTEFYIDDDFPTWINDWEGLREYLNEAYTVALSDLMDYEEL